MSKDHDERHPRRYIAFAIAFAAVILSFAALSIYIVASGAGQ